MKQNSTASTSSARFIDDLNDAIRENPVSAGLVGIGVLWMLFGHAKIGALASAIPGTVSQATSTVRSAAQSATTASSEAAENVSEAVYDATASVKAGAAAAGEKIASAGRDASQASVDFGHRVGQSVHQNLSTTIETQPLLLGALGLGIGAGIASMFSSTKAEQDLMGETGGAVKEKIHDLAAETKHRAGLVYEDVKGEVGAQDLTLDAMGESLKSVASKVKAAADAGKESFLTS